MVTLLGFFFILANVGFLQLFMPDLIGPVSGFPSPEYVVTMTYNTFSRARLGSIIALHLDYGCEWLPVHISNCKT